MTTKRESSATTGKRGAPTRLGIAASGGKATTRTAAATATAKPARKPAASTPRKAPAKGQGGTGSSPAKGVAIAPAGPIAAPPRRRAARSPTPEQSAALGKRPAATGGPNLQLRHEHIRIAAYYLAERRGFAADHELEDWLAAESEFDRRLG